MTRPPTEVFRPIRDHRSTYDELYLEYLRLHDLFGRTDPVMRNLKRIQHAAAGCRRRRRRRAGYAAARHPFGHDPLGSGPIWSVAAECSSRASVGGRPRRKRMHADREDRGPSQPHLPGLSGPGRGAGSRSLRRPDGQAHLHGVLPSAAHRARADRGPAVLPRPAAGRDRRARDDADQRRRPDDARRRSRDRCRAPSRQGSSAAARSSSAPPRRARCCSRQAQERVLAGEAAAEVVDDMARAIHASGGKAPGFGHPVHDRSTPAPSASSSSPTRAA